MIGFFLRQRRLIRASLVIYWLLLFTATHLPPKELPKTHVNDKIEHFTSFAILTGLLGLTISQTKRPLPTIAIATLAIILIYAALDELTQPFTGRTCDIHDWYADACGAIFAVAVISGTVLLSRRF